MASYGKFSGEFIDICEKQLKKIIPNKSASITHRDYKIFYNNIDNITYLLMTMPSYPVPTAISCLKNICNKLCRDKRLWTKSEFREN